MLTRDDVQRAYLAAWKPHAPPVLNSGDKRWIDAMYAELTKPSPPPKPLTPPWLAEKVVSRYRYCGGDSVASMQRALDQSMRETVDWLMERTELLSHSRILSLGEIATALKSGFPPAEGGTEP